jgi:hypothetical protein
MKCWALRNKITGKIVLISSETPRGVPEGFEDCEWEKEDETSR